MVALMQDEPVPVIMQLTLDLPPDMALYPDAMVLVAVRRGFREKGVMRRLLKVMTEGKCTGWIRIVVKDGHIDDCKMYQD